MKFNIANPRNGKEKTIDIDDETKVGKLYDKKIGQEFDGAVLGETFKGYTFTITGGIDKDGFSMMQGVLVKGRVRILLNENSKCYRAPRSGIRKRRSVRGCIVGADLRTLHIKIIQKGEKDIEGITETDVPRRLGPKRANKIRKLFKLAKHSDNIKVKGKGKKEKKVVDSQDVRRYISKRITKEIPESNKKYHKAVRIQRLVTSQRLRRKRLYLKTREASVTQTENQKKQYHELLTKLREERQKVKAEQTKIQEEVKKPVTATKPVAADKPNTKAPVKTPAPAPAKTPAKAPVKAPEKPTAPVKGPQPKKTTK
jgi:small subunit ribosomal protein S6e